MNTAHRDSTRDLQDSNMQFYNIIPANKQNCNQVIEVRDILLDLYNFWHILYHMALSNYKFEYMWKNSMLTIENKLYYFETTNRI